jgi:HEXXH motif-containing protein
MVNAVIPLEPAVEAQSTTLSNAVGTLSSTPPRDGEELAGTLVHELQHSKLWALMHVLDLCLPDSSGVRIAVPWKRDGRPPRGALQGAYAFLALAEVSASMAAATGDSGRNRDAVTTARGIAATLDALESADALTDAGQDLVSGLRERLDALGA